MDPGALHPCLNVFCCVFGYTYRVGGVMGVFTECFGEGCVCCILGKSTGPCCAVYLLEKLKGCSCHFEKLLINRVFVQ